MIRTVTKASLIIAVVVGLLGGAVLTVWLHRSQQPVALLSDPDLVLLSHNTARAIVQQGIEIQILGSMHATLIQMANRLDQLGHSRAPDAVPLRHVYPVTVLWGRQALQSGPIGWHVQSVGEEVWRWRTPWCSGAASAGSRLLTLHDGRRRLSCL